MIDSFLQYLAVERNYSDQTVLAYQNDLQEFSTFLCNDTDFDPLIATEDDVREWMVSMLDSGLKPRSVRRKLSALHSYWKFLMQLNVVQVDITQRIIRPKMNKPLPVFYKDDEMQQVQQQLWEMRQSEQFPQVRNALIIELLYETGMRRAEILSLKDSSFDFSAQQVRIFGKRKKERIVPLGEYIIAFVQQYIQLRNQTFPITDSDYNNNTPFLLNDEGRPMNPSTLTKIVKNIMSQYSSLKKQSPHVLRHTFATTMLNNGADITTIKELMGHASLAATQIYTHTTFDQIRKAYNNAHPRARRNNNDKDN